MTFVRESAHQSRTWSSSTSRWPSSNRPVGPNTVASPSRDASKWACSTTSRAAGRPSASRAAGGALVVEVEGGLGAGQVTEGRGTARAERRLGAECLQAGGAVGKGPVEVEGVGEVELGLEPHRAGVVHVVVVEGGVAGVDVQVAVFWIRGRVDAGEVKPLDRLGDQPVQLRRTDATGDGGDLGVDEPGSLPSQQGGGVDGDLGDRAGPPRRHPAGVDLRPQPGEPVAELEGVPDELLRRGRRDPQDGAELGEAELRDQRRALTRDGLLVLTPRHRERSRVVDRLRRVQVGPPGGGDEQLGGSAVLGGLLSAGEREQVASGEVVDLTCLRSCQRLDHVFDPIGDHRQ